MSTKEYTPELGQAFQGSATGRYEMPNFAVALFDSVWREIHRVFWNREQREFDPYGEDPKIAGFTVHPYWWGDETAPEAERPNFTHGDVKIYWYKYPGRGMSCDVDWSPDQWVKWFDAARQALAEYEERSSAAKRKGCKP